VIDDGSTDNTEERFSAWTKEENLFPITYKKVANGGKHRAINRGVQMAKGELFFIADSDDYLTDNALERVVEVERSIPAEEKCHFAGVCGRRGYSLEREIGTTFEGEYLDITSLERPKYRIDGDKAEVFYTSVLKNYPFPEFEGEKFVTECVVWDKIANDGYKLRFFNDIIYICEYLPDGLTASGSSIFERSPKGWGLYIAQSIEYGKIGGRAKWVSYVSFYRAMRGGMSLGEIASALHVNSAAFFVEMLVLNTYLELRRRKR